jgi:hypothetical protein
VRAHAAQIVGFSLDQRGFRGALSRKYMEGWTTDPVFSPHYHATGCAFISFLSFPFPCFSLASETAIWLCRARMLQAAHSSPEKIAHLRAAYDRAVTGGWAGAGQLEWLDDEAAVLRRAPHLADGDIKVHARACGARLADALAGRAGRRCGAGTRAGRPQETRSTRSGASCSGSACRWPSAREFLTTCHERRIRWRHERAGTFKEPILSEDGTTCVGVLAADGTRHLGDRVVLATGAWSPALVDLQGQCTSKVHFLCGRVKLLLI